MIQELRRGDFLGSTRGFMSIQLNSGSFWRAVYGAASSILFLRDMTWHAIRNSGFAFRPSSGQFKTMLEHHLLAAVWNDVLGAVSFT